MNKINKGSVIECIKTMNNSGLDDFIKGRPYQIESIEERGCYIISEDGSSVQFEFNEIKDYFKI